MLKTGNILSLVALCLLAASCAKPISIPESQPPLNKWVEEKLVPYVVDQLGNNPEFKGQPFILAVMKGDDVQAEINDLIHQIRESVISALLETPGVRLAWRPEIEPFRHHRSLSELQCREYRRIRYYIGIDAGLTAVDRDLYVKIRALDLEERAWESGFGLSWKGKPTPAQSAALEKRQTDGYLRGLRPLPFTREQPDLLAAYIARNLSCLFKNLAADGVVVHVAPGPGKSDAFFKTVFDLVKKYLVRFKEVKLVEDPAMAHVTVRIDVRAIHGPLYQVWASARDRQGAVRLPGVETETYVSLDGVLADSIGPPPVESTAPEPIPRPEPPDSGSLIWELKLVAPPSQTLCNTDSPWILGERDLENDERLPSGGCLAVDVSLSKPAYLFLIGLDGSGRLRRLFPSSCEEFSGLDNFIDDEAEESFRFPPRGHDDVPALILMETPGAERIYAVAIGDARSADDFALEIGRLRGICSAGDDFIRSGNAMVDPGADWELFLDEMIRKTEGEMEWRVVRFRHEAKKSGE